MEANEKLCQAFNFLYKYTRKIQEEQEDFIMGEDVEEDQEEDEEEGEEEGEEEDE